MKNESVYRVIALNNCCLKQLNYSNLSEGLYVLQNALSVIRQVVDMTSTNEAKNPTNTPSEEDVNPTDQRTSISVVRIMFLEESCASSSSSSTLFQDKFHHDISNEMSMLPIVSYQRPIQIFVDLCEQCTDDTEDMMRDDVEFFSANDLHVICATIIFNMALICHKLAYINRSNQTYYLMDVAKLYKILLEIVDRIDVNDISYATDAPTAALTIVTYNNYAQICYELGYPVQYHFSMKMVQSMMNCYDCIRIDDETDVDFMVGFDDSDIRLNVLSYQVSMASARTGVSSFCLSNTASAA
jgi:hypothetical protein